MANSWSKDKRPARQKYWDRHILEKRKIRRILANKQKNEDGSLMTATQALRWWQGRRKGRVMDNYIPLRIQYGT